MSLALAASYHMSHTKFLGTYNFDPEWTKRVAELQKLALRQGTAGLPKTSDEQVLVSPARSETTTRSSPRSPSLPERLFDALVNLKVSVSQYAMHVSQEQRDKIIHQLNETINVDVWYEEDQLPQERSFRQLLKWAIHSKRYGWTSIGVADDGNILVAWNSPKTLLTANFSGDGLVRWTARVKTEEGVDHAAGKCSLRSFTKQVQFYFAD